MQDVNWIVNDSKYDLPLQTPGDGKISKENGKVSFKATKVGPVRITAVAKDGSEVHGSIGVTIKSNETVKVSLVNGSNSVAEGRTIELQAAVTGGSATGVSWAVDGSVSSYPSDLGKGAGTIADDGNGKASFTGTKAGAVYVKATANDGSGVSDTLMVIVTAAPPATVPVTSITVTGAGNATSLKSGGTLQISVAAVSPTDATNKGVTWSVENGTGIGP